MRGTRALVVAGAMVALVGCGDKSPTGPTVASLSVTPTDLVLEVGETVRLNVTAKDAGGNPVAAGDVRWASSNPAVAQVDAQGNVTGVAPGTATITAETRGLTAQVPVTVVRCDASSAVAPPVGQIVVREGAAAGLVCLGTGDYTLVPFHASTVRNATLALEASFSGFVAPVGLDPDQTPQFTALSAGPSPDEAFEWALRQRERRELTPLVPGLQAALAARGGPVRNLALADLQEGDLVTLNANARDACNVPDPRVGRVVAITQRAIVVADTANPKNGLTDDEYRQLGVAFDTLVWPVDTFHFGEPTDLDNNARVLVFFTRAVNELTPAGSDSYVAGFFFARDLFPKQSQPGFSACPTSNYAEMFYMLAADPDGQVNGNRRSRELVLNTSVATLAHEFQHLINAARRLYVLRVGGTAWSEEVWLNEGLSHIAEELTFYRASGLSPRQNIDLVRLRSSDALRNAFNRYQASNFGRLIRYLQNPERHSPYDADDDLETRGAAWAFLRYAADRRGGDERDLWFNLVNSSQTGLANLQARLGTDPVPWVREWTVSVYTDDAVVTEARYQQPSWNFRSIMSGFTSTGGRYPLKVVRLDSATSPYSFTLNAGSGAFLRGGVAPGAAVKVRFRSGGSVPPGAFQLAIVRTR
jgi:hypothetical protein